MTYYPRPSRCNPPLTAALIASLAVRSPDTGCLEWSGALSGSGYGIYHHAGKMLFVHREAYRLEKGEIGDLLVCHKCDNRKCVDPEHLFLGTNRENIDDMLAKGRSRKGERHGRSKLTESDVLQIRLKRSYGESLRSIAKEFGVSHHAIRLICDGKRWGHLPFALHTR